MNKQEGQINYVPSKYSKLLNHYSKSYMKWVGPFLNCISKSCYYGSKYPIFKVLKAISKIFLLNEIQIIFLAYMIQSTSWDIKDKLITYNSQSIRDVVCYSNDQPQYKSLILYLMVTSYSVKFYLNQSTTQVLQEANKICPNFKMIFQNWAKKHTNLTQKINPKTLNRVYMNLITQTRKQEPDFNMIVDAIIQISPAYNPEKNDVKKKQYAEVKREPIKKIKPDNPIIIQSNTGGSLIYQNKQDQSHQNEAPAFSSSALYDIALHGKNVVSINHNHNKQIGFNSLHIFRSKVNPLNKSGGFLGSSIIGMPNQGIDLGDKDDQICQSLLLNLKQGQSEQNIIIQQNNQEIQQNIDQPTTSIINLNLRRGNSFLQKYLQVQCGSKKQQ